MEKDYRLLLTKAMTKTKVVTEAIVNAVAHRDYTDNSSVQVMLFADRLDVMNSGGLPPPRRLLNSVG